MWTLVASGLCQKGTLNIGLDSKPLVHATQTLVLSAAMCL